MDMIEFMCRVGRYTVQGAMTVPFKGGVARDHDRRSATGAGTEPRAAGCRIPRLGRKRAVGRRHSESMPEAEAAEGQQEVALVT